MNNRNQRRPQRATRNPLYLHVLTTSSMGNLRTGLGHDRHIRCPSNHLNIHYISLNSNSTHLCHPYLHPNPHHLHGGGHRRHPHPLILPPQYLPRLKALNICPKIKPFLQQPLHLLIHNLPLLLKSIHPHQMVRCLLSSIILLPQTGGEVLDRQQLKHKLGGCVKQFKVRSKLGRLLNQIS